MTSAAKRLAASEVPAPHHHGDQPSPLGGFLNPVPQHSSEVAPIKNSSDYARPLRFVSALGMFSVSYKVFAKERNIMELPGSRSRIECSNLGAEYIPTQPKEGIGIHRIKSQDGQS